MSRFAHGVRRSALPTDRGRQDRVHFIMMPSHGQHLRKRRDRYGQDPLHVCRTVEARPARAI